MAGAAVTAGVGVLWENRHVLADSIARLIGND
jgi:hypothetical protein